MTDRPIIFSAPMILALLDGTKHQTRRLAWTSKSKLDAKTGFAIGGTIKPSPWQKVKPGDRLWTRERWAWSPLASMSPQDGYEQFLVMAEPAPADPDFYKPWRPSIHMPRWASRLTLIVTATKIERLNDISEADAVAEGVTPHSDPDLGCTYTFAELWDALHGPGAWNANPEVVAITFKVIKSNIDSISALEAA